jgi:hypothetical protein
LKIWIWILPFDLAQGGESFDFAQDREPVENSELVEVVERLVEPFVICYLEFSPLKTELDINIQPTLIL